MKNAGIMSISIPSINRTNSQALIDAAIAQVGQNILRENSYEFKNVSGGVGLVATGAEPLSANVIRLFRDQVLNLEIVTENLKRDPMILISEWTGVMTMPEANYLMPTLRKIGGLLVFGPTNGRAFYYPLFFKGVSFKFVHHSDAGDLGPRYVNTADLTIRARRLDNFKLYTTEFLSVLAGEIDTSIKKQGLF